MAGHDNDDKTDLTRIEDLAAFTHEEDDEDEDKALDSHPAPPIEEETPPENFEAFEEENAEETTFSLEDEASEEFMDSPAEASLEEEHQEETNFEFPSLDEETLHEDIEDQKQESFEAILEEEDSQALELPSAPEDEGEETPLFSQEEEIPAQAHTANKGQEEIKKEVVLPPPSTAPLRPAETFQDVKVFAETLSYGKIAKGGSPAFSLIMNKIKTSAQQERIWNLLDEHGLIGQEIESEIRDGLERGSLLLSQINEYCAVFLANQLKTLEIEILFGPSDLLHPTNSYEAQGQGQNGQFSVGQNQTLSEDIESHEDLFGGENS